jgi:hypothetical protein
VIFALRCLYGHVVDARKASLHQTAVIELPILVSVRPEPFASGVVRRISLTDSNAIDGRPALTSANEHYARLDAAASTWRLADTAEGQLLASIAIDLKLDQTAAPAGVKPALKLV